MPNELDQLSESSMKSNYLFLCFITLMMLSCQEPEVKQPFSDEKISLILRDLIIIEAVVAGKTNQEADSISALYRDTLFAEHMIDSLDLLELERFLKSKPELSLQLHQSARNELEKLQRIVN